MTYNDTTKFLILRSLGNFLFLMAIYGVIATFGPALMYEVEFHIAQARGIQYTVSTADQANALGKNETKVTSPGFGSLLFGDKQQVIVAPDTSFSIVIPKIGAAAKIIPNVDPSDPNIYMPDLMKGVAHAKGSVFPDNKGTVYLFAHSTDTWWDVPKYNAVFYLVKDLVKGDEIVIFFEGKRYNYIVSQTELTGPENTSLLENSHNTGPQLVLQTCYPPGTSLERLFVIAKPKKA